MATGSRIQLPPLLVALVGWLVPGGGYLLIGQRARGLTVGLTILAIFTLGLLIGGVRIIESPFLSSGATGTFMYKVTQRPWFVAQVLAGPITIIVGNLAKAVTITSHARVSEIGTLYTAVAGMLNLLAVIDSGYRAGHREAKA